MNEDIDFFPDEEVSVENESIFNPSMERKTERGIARTGARIFETTFGSLGDIVQTAEGLMRKGSEALTGKTLPEFSMTKDIFHLPTTDQMKEIEKGFLGQYLEPQNRLEEFGDDITNSLTSLMLMKVPGTQALRGSILGTGLKHIGKSFDAPEWVQTGLDMLGITLGSAKYPNINAFKNELYTSTKNSLKQNELMKTNNLASELEPLLEKLSKGSQKVPQKGKVKEIISELYEKARTGAMEVGDVWEYKKDIYNMLGDYQNVGKYKNNLKSVNNHIKNALYSHASENPEFVDNLKKADKFFGEVADFDKAGGFIKDIKNVEKYSAALALVTGNILKLTKILGVSSLGKGVYNLLKHPKIIELYSDAIGNGLKRNKVGAINGMRKLDNEIKSLKDNEIEFYPD